jgi:MoaA/NifB/PqqE/SkfB family radical SAM enzyme
MTEKIETSFIPWEIMINIINECQLKCVSCISRKLNEEKFQMPYNKVLKVIDKIAAHGIRNIHLTPTYGEPTSHNQFYKILEYIENHDGIDKVSFFTNFLDIDLDRIMKLTKTKMIISVYGDNEESYAKITGIQDSYKKFYDNMVLLLSKYRQEFLAVEFYLRNPELNKHSKLYTIMDIIVRANPIDFDGVGNHIVTEFMSVNGNWCGLFEEVSDKRIDKKKGICKYALMNNSIQPNGDVVFCGACMAKPTEDDIIGNIFEQSLYDIYKLSGKFSDIVYEQRHNNYTNSCKLCSEFHKLTEE